MKDQSLFFIRHGKLSLPYASHADMPFEVLADLASGKMSPPIDEDFFSAHSEDLQKMIPFDRIERIYTSPSARCQHTGKRIAEVLLAQYKKDITPSVVPELQEVHFDLRLLYDEHERNSFTLSELNSRVLAGIANGCNGCESAQDAYGRVHKLFETAGKEQGAALLITHDFIMRIIEIYIRNQGKLVSFSTEIFETTGRNDYLQGFATDKKLSQFARL